MIFGIMTEDCIDYSEGIYETIIGKHWIVTREVQMKVNFSQTKSVRKIFTPSERKYNKGLV